MNYHDKKHREWVLNQILEVLGRVNYLSDEFEDISDNFEVNAYDEIYAMLRELEEVTV